MKIQRIGKLVISLSLPLGIGGVAGMFTATAIPVWYASLNKPSFNPPNWVFGPVWTMLYLLLGISLFMIWSLETGKERKQAILAFILQLFLNFGWSFLFFYSRMIGVALIEIAALWIAIILMLLRFYRIKPTAAYINIPYLVWVSFAGLLNAAYYLLNRS